MAAESGLCGACHLRPAGRNEATATIGNTRCMIVEKVKVCDECYRKLVFPTTNYRAWAFKGGVTHA